MKKLNVFCALFFLLTVTGFTQQASLKENNEVLKSPSISVSLVQPDEAELKFKLVISNPGEETLTVNVIDKYYGIINSKKINVISCNLLYDMQELQDGTYYIEVSGISGKVSKEIKINTEIRETRIVSIGDKKKERRLLGF